MAYPMIKTDCTDGKDGLEVISCNPGILGNIQVVTWCPKFGTLSISTEHADGTMRNDTFETRVSELAEKEFRKTKMRRFIDMLLDFVC